MSDEASATAKFKGVGAFSGRAKDIGYVTGLCSTDQGLPDDDEVAEEEDSPDEAEQASEPKMKKVTWFHYEAAVPKARKRYDATQADLKSNLTWAVKKVEKILDLHGKSTP